MNTEIKVSPDNLSGDYFENKFENECPCCGSKSVTNHGWDRVDDDMGIDDYSCNDCDSYWTLDFKIEFRCTLIRNDSFNTYERWVAENRDKKIDEILAD